MSFSSLLEAAIAGTLRQEPPALLAEDEVVSVEARLLRGASYEGLRRLAGRPVEHTHGGVQLEPARSEVLAEIPPAATVRLAELLEARPDLLPEWLELVVARNRRVPPLRVPDLLEYARSESNPDLRELIGLVGGERMAWLARLNPDWQFASYLDPEQQLTFGTPDERAAALRRLRRQDPTRGRQVLEVELWPAERGEARARLLQALEIGLSADDEPFLTRAIRDARHDVRHAALALIQRIAGSAFGQRWAERARQVVAVKHGLLRRVRIEIREPAEAPPAWVADGLDPTPPKGIGMTAWLLQQVLALAPPSIWPRAALDAMLRTDWSLPLLTGLAEAARCCADPVWSEDLIMLWAASTSADRKEKLPFSPGPLFAALDARHAEAVLRRVLELDPMLASQCTGVRSDAWSLDFSRFIAQRLGAWLPGQNFPLVSFVREAARLLDPRVLPDVERILEVEMPSDWVRSSVVRLVDTLDYRLAMRKELDD